MNDRLGAVYAIQQLVDVQVCVALCLPPLRRAPALRSQLTLCPNCHTLPSQQKLGEAVSRLSRFAGLLHAVLAQPCEPRLADAAAHCLGALVRAGGALTADVVEREVRCLNKTSKPESFSQRE